jgi:EAL domain-containing protein (putative c-di-GMP-specific phosphodiesterase class I)
MTQLHRVNAIQQQFRDVLSLSHDDYRLEISGDAVAARYLGLQIRSVFQPIIDLRVDKVLGYEALLRANKQHGNAISPSDAFRQAEVAERLVKFDRLCRTLHTLNYLNMGVNDLLFLNVHPDLLLAVHGHGKVFEQVLHQHDVPTQHVVIEINESAISQTPRLIEAIENYRRCGYRIALDNFGAKQFDLQRLWDLSPDFVKLDRTFLRKLEVDKRLHKTTPQLIEAIYELGIEVIAVGVETSDDLERIKVAGIHLAQGNHLGRPVD